MTDSKMLLPLALFKDKNHQNTTLIKVKGEKGTKEWIDVDVLKNAELVGERIAKFIEFLGKQDIPTIDTANMEFIGHGVGAHIAAIGMYIYTFQKTYSLIISLFLKIRFTFVYSFAVL